MSFFGFSLAQAYEYEGEEGWTKIEVAVVALAFVPGKADRDSFGTLRVRESRLHVDYLTCSLGTSQVRE